MGWRENRIISDRLENLGSNEKRFRINAGTGWVSEKKIIASKSITVKLRPGDMVLRNARPLHGAPEGWPDLVGWDTIEITSDMVGQKIAVMVGEEVKATGKLSPAQRKFRNILVKMGGRFFTRKRG